MGYLWYNLVSNQRLFRETDLRPINDIFHQCQLRLYGHMARYPEADPAWRIVFKKHNLALRRPKGCLHNSWLCVSRCLLLGVTQYGMESAWGLHGDLHDHRERRHRISEVKCPLAYAPHDWWLIEGVQAWLAISTISQRLTDYVSLRNLVSQESF